MLVHESVGKFGAPYFDNMLPTYRGYGNGISCYQCCAYQFANTPETDPKFNEKLYFDGGQHFSMGGWQVVSLNMPRIAYRANGDYDKLLEAAQENMRLAVDVFKTKQHWMKKALANKMVPFAIQEPRDPHTGERGPPAVDFSELVNVIGVVGVNEMVQHFTGKQLHESDDAVRVAIRLLLDMEKYRKGLEMRNGFKLMLARTPAESTAQTFAISDLVSPVYKKYANQIVKGDLEQAAALAKGKRDLPVYYSNGTHTYVGAKIPLGKKIDIEHKFFPILSGGNIFHAWLGEACSDPEALYKLTQRICRNSQIGYFSYTKDLTVCSKCASTSAGMLKTCPSCGSENVRWWSRITGYYTDVTGWNEGKRQELMDRYRVTI
jgi:anaerobic ribonucleoside-triphosphate reductase